MSYQGLESGQRVRLKSRESLCRDRIIRTATLSVCG